MRILFCCNFTLISDLLIYRFSQEENLEIVKVCETNEDLIASVKEYRPQIIFSTLYLSGTEVFQSFKLIRQLFPDIKFILLSEVLNIKTNAKYIHFGVDGILSLRSDYAEIYHAFNSILNGHSFYTKNLLTDFFNRKNNALQLRFDLLSMLSVREKEVLHLILEGYSNKEIGLQLFLSTSTIDSHRKNLMGKIGVTNTVGLLKFIYTHKAFEINEQLDNTAF